MKPLLWLGKLLRGFHHLVIVTLMFMFDCFLSTSSNHTNVTLIKTHTLMNAKTYVSPRTTADQGTNNMTYKAVYSYWVPKKPLLWKVIRWNVSPSCQKLCKLLLESEHTELFIYFSCFNVLMQTCANRWAATALNSWETQQMCIIWFYISKYKFSHLTFGFVRKHRGVLWSQSTPACYLIKYYFQSKMH